MADLGAATAGRSPREERKVVTAVFADLVGSTALAERLDPEEVKPAPMLERAPIAVLGWMPGYPDPEYMLRLLLHSDAFTNAGPYSSSDFDARIEAARRAQTDRERLELFHQADRFAVADQVALIPLVYGRSTAFVQPYVHGWWEFAKSSASYADLVVDGAHPRE